MKSRNTIPWWWWCKSLLVLAAAIKGPLVVVVEWALVVTTVEGALEEVLVATVVDFSGKFGLSLAGKEICLWFYWSKNMRRYVSKYTTLADHAAKLYSLLQRALQARSAGFCMIMLQLSAAHTSISAPLSWGQETVYSWQACSIILKYSPLCWQRLQVIVHLGHNTLSGIVPSHHIIC